MKLRKIIISLLIIAVLLYLASCQGRTKYQFSQSFDSIHSIEIIDIPGDGAQSDRELGKITIIQTISPTDWQLFLNSLQDIPCRKYWNDPPQYIRNRAVQITYKDGTIEILSSSSSGLCTEVNGFYKVIDYNRFYFDDEIFLAILNSYTENDLSGI